MATTKEKKIEELVNRLVPELKEPMEKFLQEQKILDKKEFARLTALLVDAFDETLAEQPNQKRMERKLRELIMGLFSIEYEGNIQDEILSRATKIIREKIVRKGEREKLAQLLSAEIIENWLSMDEDRIERVGGFDGLLEQLQDKAEGDLDFSDSELIDILMELGKILIGRYLEKLEPAQLDEVMTGAAGVCGLIESEEKAGDSLLSLAQSALHYIGFISLMRRAFAGLLLSDLIVHQIGKSLGLKEKISVTDFIIYVGVKVFETENLATVDKAQVARIKKTLEEIIAL